VAINDIGVQSKVTIQEIFLLILQKSNNMINFLKMFDLLSVTYYLINKTLWKL